MKRNGSSMNRDKYITWLTNGFAVRLPLNNQKNPPHDTRFFGISQHGTRDKALVAARQYRNKTLKERGLSHRLKSARVNSGDTNGN